ncbi:MAG: hypothetical protein ABSE98_08915 [Acidimicrobiales bacterium]
MLAVTAPFVAAGPTAVTQSPTARSVAAADWVEDNVVDPDVVILRFSVFGATDLEVFELLELLDLVRAKLPGEMSTPDTETVEPLTPVTLPDAMAMELRPANRRAEPAGKLGRVPLVLPVPPLRKLKPPGPANAPPVDVPPFVVRVQDPVDEGLRSVMLRAAIVVLDVFDGVPVTVTQSPAASELTDSDTVFENCVEVVQLTVVWPVLAFCTSMLDAWSAATLPLARPGAFVGVVAAPATEPIVVAATNAVAPVPRNRAQRRRVVLRLISVCMWDIPLFFLFLFVA